MKIWIKVIVSAVIGALFGIILPFDSVQVQEFFSFLVELFSGMGRYVLYPLIFFSLAYGTFELKQEKRILAVYGKAFLYAVILSLGCILLAIGTVLLFSPGRIPVMVEEESAIQVYGLKDILLAMFPKNLFTVFSGTGDVLIPLCFFAFFLGLNFTFDRLVTRPVTQFFDSMTRIFYHINTFITEVIGFTMIAFAAFAIGRLQGAAELALFRELLLLLTLDTIIVVFGVYPAILYFYLGMKNPYKWLFAIIAPAITGLVSGDNFMSLSLLIRHGKENLGIPRKIGASTFPFFAIFGKAGTAMVSSLTFLMILRSYSSLGIGFFTFFWVLFAGLIVSVAASSAPAMGAFVAVSLMCSMYGRGIEEGFLILKPVIPLIISAGACIDVLNNAFASFVIAHKEKMLKEVDIKDYI